MGFLNGSMSAHAFIRNLKDRSKLRHLLFGLSPINPAAGEEEESEGEKEVEGVGCASILSDEDDENAAPTSGLADKSKLKYKVGRGVPKRPIIPAARGSTCTPYSPLPCTSPSEEEAVTPRAGCAAQGKAKGGLRELLALPLWSICPSSLA